MWNYYLTDYLNVLNNSRKYRAGPLSLVKCKNSIAQTTARHIALLQQSWSGQLRSQTRAFHNRKWNNYAYRIQSVHQNNTNRNLFNHLKNVDIIAFQVHFKQLKTEDTSFNKQCICYPTLIQWLSITNWKSMKSWKMCFIKCWKLILSSVPKWFPYYIRYHQTV